jgi:hypothetical protein
MMQLSNKGNVPSQQDHSEKTSIDVNLPRYPIPLPKSKYKKKRVSVNDDV